MVFLFGITASTFAWFKINSNASVSGFEFTVQGGEGYQISIDDEHYSSSLTSRQMLQAILMGYNPSYKVIDDKVYYGTTYDDNGNVTSLGSLIPDETVAELVSKIELLPVTANVDATTKALSLRNYSNSTIQPSSGQYVEFSIYFRGLGNEVDNHSYGIYVLGGDGYSNDLTGETAPATSIKSKTINEVSLKATMKAIDNSNPNLSFKDRTTTNYTIGQKVNVYTSNALRFSIGNEDDDNYLANENYSLNNLIYEISDDRKYDLGSYATNYDDYCASNGITPDSLEHNLYDCNSNAQYTYYNSLRSYSPQTPMKYEDMLKLNVINHLITEDENNDSASVYFEKLEEQYITTVESGKKSHKLTFRFWLEGYDADCFEGISSAIRVNLTFGSVKIN